jgi:hypothetical protein
MSRNPFPEEHRPMNQPRIQALAGTLLLAATSLACAEIYKGVDEDGNVVYSSSPLVGADPERVQSIRIDPPPNDADVNAADQRVQGMQPRGGGQPPPPPAGTAPESPQAAEQQAAGATKRPPINWQDDEAVRRARSPDRVSQGAGGFAGESRARGGGSLPSERSAR